MTFLLLVLALNLMGCTNNKGEESNDTKDPSSISDKMIEEMEEFSKMTATTLSFNWKSGKDYKTYITDIYNVDNGTELVITINEDDSIKKISFHNSDASDEETLSSITSLIICILQNSAFDFTDGEMHAIGYGIQTDEGTLEMEPYTLEQRNFKASYSSELSEDNKKRDLTFTIEFTKELK